MNPMSKSEARVAKKKKKMLALSEVIQLNDKDKQKNRHTNSCNKSNSLKSDNDGELEPKRAKIDEKIENSVNQPVDNSKSKQLTNEQYAELKRDLTRRKSELKSAPKLRLKLFGDAAALSVDPTARTPIFLTDIQNLILGVLLGKHSPATPSRWCKVEKSSKISHVVLLIVDGLAMFHYNKFQSIFDKSSAVFKHKLEVVMPQPEEIIKEILLIPVTNLNKDEYIAKYGCLEAALPGNQILLTKSVFPVQEKLSTIQNEPIIDTNEILSRTQLLLSALQMVDEGYPVPLKGELANRYKDFILTKDFYSDVTNQSPLFGLDCEMCLTSAGLNELTRISIVDESYNCIYETFVRPENHIVDYLTQYSGITADMLSNVTKTLHNVQEDIRNLLPSDAILVGHSLNSDLLAMRMMHPYIIDTSVIFNLTGMRDRKSKLREVVFSLTGEVIQNNPLGHDSIEDSAASLKLVKLKLKEGIYFGDAALQSKKTAIAYLDKNENSNVSNRRDRNASIISVERADDSDKIDYKSMIQSFEEKSPNRILIHQVDNNKSAIAKTKEEVLNQAFTATLLKVKNHRLSDDKIEKTLNNVDQWISDVWDCVAPNGLFIVLFGGATGSPSGLSMLQLKECIPILSNNK